MTTVPTRVRALRQHPKKRILCVVSNPGTLKGFPVGVYGEELTRTVFDFVQAGHDVDLASPRGGAVELDAMSDPDSPSTIAGDDLITIGFKHHARFGGLLEDTPSIADVNVDDYDAVAIIGGGAPLVTFREDTRLHAFVAEFYDKGKVVGTVCHGACVLLWARLGDGTLLADGKTWTGYPDSEEQLLNESMGLTVNEYTIESEARKNPNTTFESAAPYEPFAIRDGRLITAQQQHSTFLMTRLMIEALSETDAS
ncbi:MAG: type 1 glutamine amidotransferase domain-containing protein [Myxococcota bacterium]